MEYRVEHDSMGTVNVPAGFDVEAAHDLARSA